jgi:hypothetical protein
VGVLRLCQEAGLVKLGHVSLDGTKIKANASRHKAMSYGRMKEEEARLRKEIRDLLEKAEAADAEEDAEYGRDRRGDELPEELSRRQDRLARIRQAKKALERKAQAAAEEAAKARPAETPTEAAHPRVAVPDDKAQYNFTDPETSIMKVNNKGFDQCGNAQIVVDREHQMIVAADVTNEANDKKQMEPMITQARRNIGKGQRIGKVSADSGYYSERNVEWAQKEDLDVYVATGRLKHGEKRAPCPRGRVPKALTVKERMARKLRTKEGRRLYAQRKWIVEPVFGQIKRAMGFRQFLLNGLAKMRGEWRMVCTAYNVRKLWVAMG